MYRMVNRDGTNFYDSLFEQSWAFFMGGYPMHALGALYAAESPFYTEVFNPEAPMLRSMVHYWLCRYDDSRNALAVAQWLEKNPNVTWVKFPGLASSPYKKLSDKYLPLGQGSIVTFGIKGGLEAGRKLIDAAQLFSHLANLGDAKSLIIHPASTTHQQLTDDQQLEAGVSKDLVRLSVGIEDLDDILWDLDQAIQASQA